MKSTIASSRDAAVTLDRLSFAYEKEWILQDVSFELPKNSFVGIIGPNGGGKTTLLQLLMGFLKPTRGTLSIFNLPPKQARSKIGWVPQGFDYDRKFPISVLEVVLAGTLATSRWFGGFGKAEKERAYAALDRVDLLKYKRCSFAELSGGQAQRVLFARALVSDPELLLLDEPTSHVDAQAEADIVALLHSLKGKITILMVTHHVQTVSRYLDHILCVQNRVSSLAPEELCNHFSLGVYHPKEPQ